MKTDKLVYVLFKLVPQAFFTLVGRAAADAETYLFKSVELKEFSFRIDGLFIPTLVNDITYFVEAQFQRDEQFYARLFAEIFVWLKQYGDANWKSVVIYPSRSAEQPDLDAYRELLESGRVLRVYLDELPSIAELDSAVALFKLIVEPKKSAATSAKLLMERAPEKLEFIQQILFYKFSNLTRKEILKMLDIEEEFEEELKKTRAYQEILQEGREEGIKQGFKEGMRDGLKEGIREGKLEGIREGKLEGKLEGRLEGKLETVPLLRKLGLTDEAIAENLNLSLDAVKAVKK